jgi:hypothetical protein
MRNKPEYEWWIRRAEMFLGDLLAEYAEQFGATAEDLCTGLWQPSRDVIRDAMFEAIDHVCFREKKKIHNARPIVDYWYRKEYAVRK